MSTVSRSIAAICSQIVASDNDSYWNSFVDQFLHFDIFGKYS